MPNEYNVGSVSDGMHWKIPDFFSMADNLEKNDVLSCSKISSTGCKWSFSLDPKGRGTGKILRAYLSTKDSRSAPKRTVSCYIGSERAHVSVESVASQVKASVPKFSFWVFTFFFGLDDLKTRKSELVPSDTLTITFYFGDEESDPPKGHLQRLTGLNNLSSNFEDLFVNKKKTDVTIKVKDKDFPVHKAVLVARSSVFSAMFGHDTSEEETGVVTVPDCDSDSFGDFLHYLYTGKFDSVSTSNARHLYVISDKYGVQALKSFCLDHMKQNLTLENVLYITVLADHYGETELLQAAHEFFNRNFGGIISTPYWRTLFAEDFEFTNGLLQQMAKVRSEQA